METAQLPRPLLPATRRLRDPGVADGKAFAGPMAINGPTAQATTVGITVRSTIHIGFPKTGTTALQRHVFPTLETLAYLGPNSGPPFSTLAENLFRADDEAYEPDSLRACLVQACPPKEINGSRSLLVSHEGFGRHHHGGRTAERLHRLLPDSTVVAVVRSQTSLLRSLYFMYLRRGGVHDLEYWAEKHFDPDWVRYDSAVAGYQQLFGTERVHVLLYEDFQQRPQEFISVFLGLIGGFDMSTRRPSYALPQVNQSPAWPSCQAMRLVNRLFRTSQCNPRPLVRSLPIDSAIRRIRRIDAIVFGDQGRDNCRRHNAVLHRLGADVAASNRRLQDLTGLSLADHGYPLDS